MKNKLIVILALGLSLSAGAVENSLKIVGKPLHPSLQKLTNDQLAALNPVCESFKTWTCHSFANEENPTTISFVLKQQGSFAQVLLSKGEDFYGNQVLELKSHEKGFKIQKWNFLISNGAELMISEQELLGRGGDFNQPVIIKSALLKLNNQEIDLFCH